MVRSAAQQRVSNHEKSDEEFDLNLGVAFSPLVPVYVVWAALALAVAVTVLLLVSRSRGAANVPQPRARCRGQGHGP